MASKGISNSISNSISNRVSNRVSHSVISQKGILSQAGRIAISNLRACYSEHGIFAGKHQFSDYWARDGLFASLGALSIGDQEIPRKELELMLTFQAHDGQLPMRVGQYFIGLKMLGLNNPKELRPRYDQDKYGSRPADQNSLFIIAFSEYLKKSGDSKFLKNNYPSLKKAIAWNISNDRDRDGLIEEGYYAGWTDSIRKKGKVLYTNVLHCRALELMAGFAKQLGTDNDSRDEDSMRYLTHHSQTKAALTRLFWNGSYYSDWLDASGQAAGKKAAGSKGVAGKRHDYFSTDGNLLAILLGIADKSQGLSIQRSISRFGISASVPSLTNHPKYPIKMQSMLDTIFGIGDYHNGLSWLWLGSLDALAKHRLGMRDEALAELDKIASIIVLHNGVYEVYTKEAKPVKRLLYKSEQPFAWSAGLFLYALSEIRPKKLKDLY